MNLTQQYRKNRQRFQQNKFHYAVWQLLLYYYREFRSKIVSVYMTKNVLSMPIKFVVDSLICSRVMTAVIFENIVSRKFHLKLLLLIFVYENILELRIFQPVTLGKPLKGKNSPFSTFSKNFI